MQRSTRPALSLLAAACLLAQGCDRADPVTDAIETASIELRKLNPAGGPPPTVDARAELYRAALTSLRGAPSKQTTAERTAIAMLTREAEAGLAEVAMSRAVDAEADLVGQIRRARALLAQWRDHRNREATARRLDPADQFAEIEEAIAEREGQIEQARAAKARIDARIEELQSQANAKLAEAEKEHVTESELRQRARATSAVEGAELIRQAREHQRTADELEVEAEMLKARIDQLQREADEAQLEIDRVTTQRQLLARAKADVQQSAQVAAEHAQQAAADAQQSASKLTDKLDAIARARAEGGDLAQAYEQAFASRQRALAAARTAQRDGNVRNAARASIGAAQQSIADAHMSRARGIDAYANLLERVVAEGDELPGAGARETALADARAAARQHRAEAAEAYQSARDAYAGTRLTGQSARQHLEELDRLLAELSPEGADGAEPPANGDG